MKIKNLSVIIPAYKNERTIKNQIEEIVKILNERYTRREIRNESKKNIEGNYEIIVVVDGVTDKTFEKAKEIKNKNVKVYQLDKNKGKGYAFKYGFLKSFGRIVLLFDGGKDINPNGIPLILEHFVWYKADIVIGSKLHSASVVNYPNIRRLSSFIYYLLVKFLFRLKVRDTQTGFKLFKREVLKKVIPKMRVDRFAFDIELLALAKKYGYDRIYEAPVEVNIDFNRSSSIRLFSSKVVWGILFDTLLVWFRLQSRRYKVDGGR